MIFQNTKQNNTVSQGFSYFLSSVNLNLTIFISNQQNLETGSIEIDIAFK